MRNSGKLAQCSYPSPSPVASFLTTHSPSLPSMPSERSTGWHAQWRQWKADINNKTGCVAMKAPNKSTFARSKPAGRYSCIIVLLILFLICTQLQARVMGGNPTAAMNVFFQYSFSTYLRVPSTRHIGSLAIDHFNLNQWTGKSDSTRLDVVTNLASAID